MKREEGRREAKLIVPADFLEREAELAAVYARRRRAQLSASAPEDSRGAPRRREAFKVNTQTEVTASVRSCKTAATIRCPSEHGSDARPARAAHPNESAVSETVTNIGTDARPLLLIGQDNWELITGSDVRRGKSGEPVASLTGLGVVRYNAERARKRRVKRASRILNDTTRRIGNKWETGLWKEDDPRFPDNYNGARKRLTNIENKMDRDLAFAAAYTAQIEKLIENGYARRFRIGSVASRETSGTCFCEYVSALPINERSYFCGECTRAGLRYPGWATNAPELKESSSAESSAEAATVSPHKTKTERALGLIWEPECDSLGSTSHSRSFRVIQDRAPRIRRRERTRVRGRRLLARGTTRRHGTSALVAGKSRVAPNKVMSIPRLELQAALLACRLATNIQKEHGIATERRVLWCDSKTVLRWIRSDPRAYKPFVAHRLAELDERPIVTSGVVNSADNPADDATRADCDLERWLNGPTFLLRNEDAWPIDNDVVDERVADDEVKGESINVVCTTHTGDVIDVTRFSSWTRLVRTYARVLYFIRRLRKQQQPFGADDVIDAETRLLRASQRRAFSDEMRAAAVGGHPRGSSLRALDVMLTDDWHERPGSRRPPARRALSPASGPRQSRSSCKHHPGKILDHETQTDGEESGQRLPPVSSSTRTAGHAEDGRPEGASPSSKAIYAHRVDYFGPLEVTVGRRREKRWAALFTCLTTRAVHMEVASRYPPTP
ncbi:hypothetical protein EVAR_100181_1 [Eumeta japonica]|uniref:Uncharacterized protein n=1 Tax=Eumeta variegata TaxID=151549 RepID=A0A4C2A837_EUMVA|nr:hypothetical protein EVAR_100181_1 [Eumeta japonica]